MGGRNGEVQSDRDKFALLSTFLLFQYQFVNFQSQYCTYIFGIGLLQGTKWNNPQLGSIWIIFSTLYFRDSCIFLIGVLFIESTPLGSAKEDLSLNTPNGLCISVCPRASSWTHNIHVLYNIRQCLIPSMWLLLTYNKFNIFGFPYEYYPLIPIGLWPNLFRRSVSTNALHVSRVELETSN